MKLLKLCLRNFKGIRDFTLDTAGGNVAIYGKNGAGKTSIADSVNWLLFGKDSLNKSSNIKPLDKDNNEIHHLETSVEAAFDIAGKSLTLVKRQKEDWRKPHGATEKKLDGNVTEYAVNGVPKSKKDYDAFVATIAREDLFRILTNPLYFNDDDAMTTKSQRGWQVRRNMLLEIGGNIGDGTVIASNKDLADLTKILQGRTIDDHLAVIKAAKTKIDKEMAEIRTRIDEVDHTLPDIAGLDRMAISTEIAFLQDKQPAKRQEIIRIENGGQIAEKQLQLRKIEGHMVDLQNKHKYALSEKTYAKKNELDEVKRDLQSIEGILSRHSRTAQENSSRIQELQQKLTGLRQEWREINGRQFEMTQETVCPVCGQALPAEQLQAARDKATEQFNLDKVKQLEENKAIGLTTKQQLDNLQHENETLQKDIEQLTDSKAEAEKCISALQAEIDSIARAAGDVAISPEYAKALAQKTVVEKEITALAAGNTDAIAGLRNEIVAMDTEIETKQGQLLQINQRQLGEKRIAELKAKEKTLAAEGERLERERHLADLFVQTKVKLMEETINSKFKLARFKLFKTLTSRDGIEDCCETTYHGSPWNGGMSKGEQCLVGLDIIQTLSRHFKFSPFIIIDNMESITEPIEIDAQLIRLIASQPDRTLRIEREEPGQSSLFQEAI